MQHCTRILKSDLGSTIQQLCLTLDREKMNKARESSLVDHISQEILIDSQAL